MQIFLRITLAATFVLSSTLITFAQGLVESAYTDLAASKCRTLEVDKETGSSTQRCPGISGYKLLVHDDDSRQSITVVDPTGKKHDLEFWHVVTTGFSTLGQKAEWRATRKSGKLSPIAVIVRVNASENPEQPKRITSYLAVTKLGGDQICVTHKIAAGANANTEARRLADAAQAAPCLKP
jgi:hypothetical protein